MPQYKIPSAMHNSDSPHYPASIIAQLTYK